MNMKRFRIELILLAILTVALNSCTKEEVRAVLNPSVALAPTVSKTSVVLTKAGVGQDALTISWPKPDYGYVASPTYKIYIDKNSDFSTAAVLSIGGDLSKTFKTEELNALLTNLKLVPGVASTISIKVEAVLGSAKSITSSVISVSATSYTAYLDLSTTWGVVGSGFNNWGAFPDAPFFTTKTANVLVAYVTLVNGEIKFRQDNKWDNNLGGDGTASGLKSGGDNIPVTAGDYKITLNLSSNSYSIVKFSWGIVGSAYNNWGADGPDFKFTYDDATDQWRAIVKLKAGEFKIRKNNDWAVNYGDDGANGTLDAGGANIVSTAGKYIVTFNENDLTYKIESTPNIWGLVGSAYNNWGATPDAQFDRDWRNDGVWILRNVTLTAGEFKIRDGNDWATNYGDTGADGTLDSGGDNIAAVAGVYTIKLDFSTPTAPKWSKVKY